MGGSSSGPPLWRARLRGIRSWRRSAAPRSIGPRRLRSGGRGHRGGLAGHRRLAHGSRVHLQRRHLPDAPFAGNWPQLGVPGPLSPDRLLPSPAASARGAVAGSARRRPPAAADHRGRTGRWRSQPCLRQLASAFLAGTLFERDPFLKLVDAFGIMPFLALPRRPAGVPTARQRQVLLGTLVALGAYLSLTTALRDGEARCARLSQVHPRPELRHPRGPRPRAVRRRGGQRARALHLRRRVRRRRRYVARPDHASACHRSWPAMRGGQLPQPRALRLDRRGARELRRDARDHAGCDATSCPWRSRSPSRSPPRWR